MDQQLRSASKSQPPPFEKPELDSLIEKRDGAGATRTLRCRTVAAGRYRQEHFVRDLPAFGGGAKLETSGILSADSSPNPSEVLLSALGSCLSIGIQANATARAISIRHLALEISSEISFAALWGTGDLGSKSIGFDAINVGVQIEADAPGEVVKALVDYVLLWSPVANTLHNPIHLDVAVV